MNHIIQITTEELDLLDRFVEQGIDQMRDGMGELDECSPEELDAIQDVDRLIARLRGQPQTRYWVVTLPYWDDGGVSEGDGSPSCPQWMGTVSGPGMTAEQAVEQAVRECYASNRAEYPPEDGDELVAPEAAGAIEVAGFVEDE